MDGASLGPSKDFNWIIYSAKAIPAFLCNAEQMLTYLEPLPDAAYSDLSKEIWDKFLEQKQDIDDYMERIKAWRDMNDFLKSKKPMYGLMIGGSTINGFGLKDSNVDITVLHIMIKTNSIEETVERLRKELHVNNIVHPLFSDYAQISQATYVKNWYPSVNCIDRVNHKMLDVTHNSKFMVLNSHLLFHYSQVDWRVKPLGVVIKLWARTNGILNKYCKSLNSYHLILMLINYLQVGVSPAVLPSLQELFPDKLHTDMNIEDMDFRRLNIPPSENKETLEELLIGFFKHYKNFDYNKVISVRLGKAEGVKRTKVSSKKTYRGKTLLMIEEPFTKRNTAVLIVDIDVWSEIKNEIIQAHSKLQSTRKLESILTVSEKDCKMMNSKKPVFEPLAKFQAKYEKFEKLKKKHKKLGVQFVPNGHRHYKRKNKNKKK